ncbi:MAG: response regulator [Candidatus Planktophila sp.]|nr:response regulator [Candidatus Planktophila sp.]
MIRFKRAQLILAILTVVMLVVMTLSMLSTSRVPAKINKIFSEAGASSSSIIFAQREALGYVAIAKRWLRGNVSKREVEDARVLLAKRLNTFNNLSGTSVSNLVSPSSFQALKTADVVIQKSPNGFLPLQLQVTTHAAITPSLKNITGIATELFISFQKEMEVQFKLATSGRQKTLTRNLLIVYLFLLMLLILIIWVGVTFSAGYKSIKDSIKTQMDDLSLNTEELERTQVVVTELRNLDNERNEFNSNLTKLAVMLQGQRDRVIVSKTVLSELASLLNFQHGVFYVMNESISGELRLKMLSSYAYKERKNIPKVWKMGEGLIGQCAIEKKRILLTNVPDDYIQITSGLGQAKPLNILVLPIIFEGKVKAVIELAAFTQFSSTQVAFLDQLAESIGTVLNTIEASTRTEELLKESQTLTEELQLQKEELRQTNDELAGQAQMLEEQKMEVETKNLEVGQAKAAIEEKASQLELTSRYKSEFLANMSHELRTPLNNLLILSGLLAENKSSHLDLKEMEFATLIHTSGNDLLSLINEVLDLSKIESGTVSLNLSELPFAVVHDQIENVFRHAAESRKLGFEVIVAGDLPPAIITDEMRLLQVIKNLLSNAFKFTEKGQVSLRVNRATSGWSTDNQNLNKADEVFAFTVEDTGIGISADQQFMIFEAFQQGDGGTARKYGGTGLGLSISREIARLMGGELKLLRSATQQGSTFVLYVPQKSLNTDAPTPILESGRTLLSEQHSKPVNADSAVNLDASERALRALHESEAADDRATIKDGDRVLLIIEDDPIFAKIILDLAREKGFKGIVAMRGIQALELVRSYRPDAITLDIHLPDLDGWTILDILKRDHDLRHIPVNIISMENDPLPGLSQGALQHLTKPVSRDQLAAAMDAMYAFLDRPMKNLLLVAADKGEDKQITDLLGDGDITIHHAAGGKSGLVAMSKKSFDCVVVGTKLSDMSGTDFIAALRQDKLLIGIPVVIFISVPLTDSDQATLRKLASSSVIKSAESLEHLLDQTALFLHRVVSRLPEEKRKLLLQLQEAANNLDGKKVLIVDDDARNIFALTAALERRGVVVLSAENGATAIDLLKRVPDMDLVLMDIMMPDMDGYETMHEIRKLGKFKKLPIIALTANAMVGDREKCLEAGASDYLSKPVNIVQLSSLMQVWLSK